MTKSWGDKMRNATLRSLLILVGWISFPGLLIGSVMLVFGPYLSAPRAMNSYGSYLYIQFLILTFGTPGVAAISFWAAHNLKPLNFLARNRLSKILSICVVLNILSFLFSLLNIPLELSTFGFDSGSLVTVIGYAFCTFIYAASASLLLLFARKQILAKTAGDKINESILAETFS